MAKSVNPYGLKNISTHTIRYRTIFFFSLFSKPSTGINSAWLASPAQLKLLSSFLDADHHD
jgi:hypothetical protein